MRTNTLLVTVYCLIALVATALVYWFGIQYQKTERLLTELNSLERQEQRKHQTKELEPKRSMRPALLRLQRLLEERTLLVQDQKSQLNQQISGRQKLQQKYESLTNAYEELRSEHELLINEVDFYLSAFGLASDEELRAAATAVPAASVPGSSVATSDENETVRETDEPVENAIEELDVDDIELLQLRQELADLSTSSRRDARISGLASQAMIEMGAAAIPMLLDVLDDDDPNARSWGAWILGQIGPDAAVVVPELELLLQDKSAEVASAAEDALRKIGSR